MPYSKKTRKGRSRRFYKSKRKAKLGRGMMTEVASLVQEIELSKMTPAGGGSPVDMAAGQINGLWNMSLKSCDRAVQVARAYQQYRISKIEVFVKPNQDTFASSNAIPTGNVPYFYYLIDKGYNMPTPTTFNALRDAGAKPHRLDDKIIKFSYRPAVTVGSYDLVSGVNNSVLGITKVSPWLSTNQTAGVPQTGNPSSTWTPSSIDHRGLIWGVEQYNQPAFGGNPATYQLTIRVHFQFRKPNSAINVTLNEENIFQSQDIELLGE